jgi:hypothetical protein
MGNVAKGRVDEEICRRDLPYRNGQITTTDLLHPLATARPPSNSIAYTEYLLDVLPSGLPFGVVNSDIGLSATGEKSLKGIGFRPEEIVSRNDLRHKS